MNLKLPTFNFSSRLLKTKSFLLFWLLIAIVFIMDIFALKTAVSQIYTLKKQTVGAAKPRGIRINFTDYEAVLQKKNRAENFTPVEISTTSPFRLLGK